MSFERSHSRPPAAALRLTRVWMRLECLMAPVGPVGPVGLIVLIGLIAMLAPGVVWADHYQMEPGLQADSAREPAAIRAQLVPRRQTVLGAEISGRIASVAVEEGQSFRRGDRLIAFDCAAPRARLERAQAQLMGARKTLEVHQRLVELGSLSALELELDLATARQAAAEVAIHQAQVAGCQVKAPFAGQTRLLSVHPHQYVNEGDPLIEIIDNSQLDLVLMVPSRLLPHLGPGTPFTVTLDETGLAYPATIRRVVPEVLPVNQTVKVVGSLTGAFRGLISGMSGAVSFAGTLVDEPGNGPGGAEP